MAKKQTTKSVISEKEAVKPLPKSGDVTIIATGKAKAMKEGKEYVVSAIAAKGLIDKGFAKLK